MKTLFKAVLTIVGVAVAANMAHATLIGTETQTLTANGLPTDKITVTSTVTLTAGLYTYDYYLTVPSGSTLIAGVDAFTVYDLPTVMIGSLITPGSITATSPFVGSANLNHVLWTDNNTDKPLPLDFSFTSPYGPTQGTSGALDDQVYNPTSGSVYVPVWSSVPDSSLTMSLLGGTMLGLGFIRRKLGC